MGIGTDFRFLLILSMVLQVALSARRIYCSVSSAKCSWKNTRVFPENLKIKPLFQFPLYRTLWLVLLLLLQLSSPIHINFNLKLPTNQFRTLTLPICLPDLASRWRDQLKNPVRDWCYWVQFPKKAALHGKYNYSGVAYLSAWEWIWPQSIQSLAIHSFSYSYLPLTLVLTWISEAPNLC